MVGGNLAVKHIEYLRPDGKAETTLCLRPEGPWPASLYLQGRAYGRPKSQDHLLRGVRYSQSPTIRISYGYRKCGIVSTR